MRTGYILWAFIFLLLTESYSQTKNTFLKLGVQGGYTSGNTVPFWLRSNQYGSVPLDKASLSLLAAGGKNYDTTRNRIFDWAISAEGRLNAGYKTEFILIEGVGRMKLGIFELSAGRAKETMGLCDTLLSSGSWSVSGNALGVPKVQIAIPEYYTIPWFGKVFAFKGQFAHGWLGDVTMNRPHLLDLVPDTIENKTYFHQKSIYGRFGKSNWKFKMYAGFNHQVTWGNEDVFYGDVYTLTPLETYYNVVVGKPYFNDSIPTHSKIGNHLGSIDIGFEYNFKKFRVLLYRQNFYDVGNLYYLTNIRDGLNGISITNLQPGNKEIVLNRIVFEFLYTKSQGGQPGAKATPTPFEQYYNNGQFIEGWSYNDVGLGTPFITPKIYIRDHYPVYPRTYFANNRVIAYHLGVAGSIYNWDYLVKASYSKNYGTYYTTDEEQSTEIENPGEVGIFGEQQQFSAYLYFNRDLPADFTVGWLCAFDIGDLFYNSFGLFVTTSKSF